MAAHASRAELLRLPAVSGGRFSGIGRFAAGVATPCGPSRARFAAPSPFVPPARLVPGATSTAGALCQVAIDTLLFDPCWVAVFFVVTGALERRPARETVANLRAEWRAAVCGSWAVSAVLFPIQWASFRCLPVEARVLSVNLIDVCWTATMSWFSHRRRRKHAD